MSLVQYASGRTALPYCLVTVESGGAITSIKAGTYYFWVQGRNAIGFNNPSIVSTVTVSAGQRIRVCISNLFRMSGEFWEEFFVSCSTTNDPTNSCIVASYKYLDPTTGLVNTLPHDILLSNDQHLQLYKSVATPAELPTSTDLVEGMVRSVASLGRVYQYAPLSNATVDNINILASSVGQWVYHAYGFNIHTSNIEEFKGCDQSLFDIEDDSYATPIEYSADGSLSKPRTFYISNNSNIIFSKGTRIAVSLEFGGEDKSRFFDSLLQLTFKGYVDLATGILDDKEEDGLTVFSELDVQRVYKFGQNAFYLYKDLEPGKAFILEARLQFNLSNIANVATIPNRTGVSIYPFFVSASGEYNSATETIGDLIMSSPLVRRRILPGPGQTAIAASGSGSVKGFTFYSAPEAIVPYVTTNTANQKIAIDGNGGCYALGSVPPNMAQRAIVGTLPCETAAAEWSEPFLLNINNPIQVTVLHPCNSVAKGEIRSDYPDVIAGMVGGYFNVESMNIYIQNLTNNQIRKFSGNAVLGDVSQQLSLTFSSGTIVSSLPTSPSDLALGLYAPIKTMTVTGTTSTNSFRVTVSYVHTGNTVTKISHSKVEGCIPEITGTIIDAVDNAFYWGAAINTAQQLREIPVSSVIDKQVRVKGDSLFMYHQGSMLVDDGVTVIKPDEILITNPGRWLQLRAATADWASSAMTVADLRLFSLVDIIDRQARILAGSVYIYDQTSLAVDDGVTTIKPDGLLIGESGRWLKLQTGSTDWSSPTADSYGLRAIASSEITNQQVRVSNDLMYLYNSASVMDDNDSTVFKPDDIDSLDPGRWVKFQPPSLNWSPPVADIYDLAAISISDIVESQARIVGDSIFIYSTTSTLTDDSSSVIRPYAIDTGDPGRWLKFTTPDPFWGLPLDQISDLENLDVSSVADGQTRTVYNNGKPLIYQYSYSSTLAVTYNGSEGAVSSYGVVEADGTGRWLLVAGGTRKKSAAMEVFYAASELRAIVDPPSPYDFSYVEENSLLMIYVPDSLAVDDSRHCIKRTEVSALNPGRWLSMAKIILDLISIRTKDVGDANEVEITATNVVYL